MPMEFILERLHQLIIYLQIVGGIWGFCNILYMIGILAIILELDDFDYHQKERMKNNTTNVLLQVFLVGAFFSLTIKF